VILGTPEYMSPEQASAEPNVDARSDIFSAGCVLYEMLAGDVPFRGPTAQAVIARRMSEPPPSLRVIRATISATLERVVTTALARSPADRFQSAADLRSAIDQAWSEARQATAARPVPRSSARGALRRHAAVALGLAAALAVIMWTTTRPRSTVEALDRNLIVIAPFDVLDPQLALWKQGFVDVLAANLDGAGTLRTVSPSSVIRRWSGRADRASAAAVARATGAGISIFGRLEPAGSDSLRCTVWIDDAISGQRLGEVQLRETAERMDRLGDSLTMRILRELGLSNAVGSARIASLGSRSLPAIKLFLQGEQHYRRVDLDSAQLLYERAVAIDSSFGLAINRLAGVLGWQGLAYDTEAARLWRSAARFVNGLSPRDSMQLTADALWAQLLEFEPDSSWWTKSQRLLRTLRDMTQRSPGDFAAWNLLGETHFHLAGALGGSWKQSLAAFDRAIAIDSSFAAAWVHPIAIQLAFQRPRAAHRYLAGLLRAQGPRSREDWVNVLNDVVGGTLSDAGEFDRSLTNLSLDGRFQVWAAVSKWQDSSELALVAARAFANARPAGHPLFDDQEVRNNFLFGTLLQRGHFREALRMAGAHVEAELPYLAALNVIPPDSAATLFDAWLRRGSPNSYLALDWLAARADTGAIRRFGAIARSHTRSTVAAYRHFGTFEVRVSDAYLALARRDTARAINLLLAVPDSLCPTCFAHRLTLVQLLLAAGRAQTADSILQQDLSALQLRSPTADFRWQVARGQAAERTGATASAIEWYDAARQRYASGDPEARQLSQALAGRIAALRRR
jgi:serine/threonine-protein kinase